MGQPASISRLVLNTFVSAWLAGLAEIVTQQLSVTLILVRTERRVSTSKHHTLVNVHQDGLVKTVPLPLTCVNSILVRTERRVLTSRHLTLVNVHQDGLVRIVPLPLISVCLTLVRTEQHVPVSRRPILVSVQPDGPDRIVPLPSSILVCPILV